MLNSCFIQAGMMSPFLIFVSKFFLPSIARSDDVFANSDSRLRRAVDRGIQINCGISIFLPFLSVRYVVRIR